MYMSRFKELGKTLPGSEFCLINKCIDHLGANFSKPSVDVTGFENKKNCEKKQQTLTNYIQQKPTKG